MLTKDYNVKNKDDDDINDDLSTSFISLFCIS